MINIISGGNHTEKTDNIIEGIKESLENDKQVYVIIPDQFSFEYDKKLYKTLKVKLFNKIPVLSFTKVSKEIINIYGTQSGEYADDNAKQIMMYKTLQKVKKEKSVDFYKKQVSKPEFVHTALDMIKDLRQSAIEPDDINNVKNNVDGILQQKVLDISNIYQSYCETLKENGLKDSLTIINEASETALKNKHFAGFDVFIDEFNSFSADEINMLSAIICQADNLSIALTIGEDNNSKTKLSPFTNVKQTQQKVIDIAKEFNKPLNFVNCNNYNYKSKSIDYLNKNIYYSLKNTSDTNKNISVINADDIYNEIEYVSAQIKHLIVDEKYKYSEIAVIARSLGDYENVIESTFQKYEIPYFMDTRQNVTQKSLILYIYSIFECVTTKKYNTEAILRYVKSSLSLLGDLRISQIEEYCYKWNVNKDMWLSDFTADDSFYNKKVKDKDGITYLERINETRSIIISPLEKFKKICENATVKEICRAFYELLEGIGLNVAISESIKKASENNKDNENSDVIEISRDFKQLWQVFNGVVKSIYTNISNEKMSLKEFYQLLKIMLSQSTVSTPPQRLDSVTVASVERSKLSDGIRATFVIGVNEGIMPQNVKETGLFTDRDKQNLISAGLKISQSVMWKIAQERFTSYMALTSPSEKLYISFSHSDLMGTMRRPSPIIKQVLNMFGNDIIINTSEINPEFYCVTLRSGYSKYIENIKSQTTSINCIKEVLLENEEYKKKIEFANSINEEVTHFITKEKSKALLTKDGKIFVSATKLENYSRCPFLYFCQYGLGLKTVKTADVNPINRGNIVHFCLENILSTKNKDGQKLYNSDFTKFTEDELQKEINYYLDLYMKEDLGGNFGKTSRFKFLYDNLSLMVLEVLKNIQLELLKCDFVPEAFEYNLIKNNTSILQLDIAEGIKVSISGKIDRVDVFEKDEKKYIRIIDYKTGKKELSFEDIYNGLDLQMIVYLSALVDGDDKYKDSIPAGIMYMPARFLETSLNRNTGEDDVKLTAKIEAQKQLFFRRNGIIVDILESYNAMGNELVKKFIKLKRDSSNLLPEKEFSKLSEFATNKIKEVAEKIIKGDIDAIPTGTENYLPCDNCDYWSVCGNYKTYKAKIITSADKEKLLEIINQTKEGEDNA